MTTCLLNHHEELPPPPEGTRYVRHQAGGHQTKNGDVVIPNLEHLDGSFLKFYRSPSRGNIELTFYQRVFDLDCTEPTLLELRTLIPKFHGIFTASLKGREVRFLKVEDITRQFSHPCVLDVKLKADIHDPQSNHSHPVYPFAIKRGFLIDGIHVYDRSSKKYVSFSKDYGRKLDEAGVSKALTYFLNGDSPLDKWLIQALLNRLEHVSSWAQRQCHFSFYRSSLLLVYDSQERLCQSLEEALSRTDVRMVDFAKVHPSACCDQRYLQAVQNLTDYFSQILQNSSHSSTNQDTKALVEV